VYYLHCSTISIATIKQRDLYGTTADVHHESLSEFGLALSCPCAGCERSVGRFERTPFKCAESDHHRGGPARVPTSIQSMARIIIAGVRHVYGSPRGARLLALDDVCLEGRARESSR